MQSEKGRNNKHDTNNKNNNRDTNTNNTNINAGIYNSSNDHKRENNINIKIDKESNNEADRLIVKTPNIVNKYNENNLEDIIYKYSIFGKETRNAPKNKTCDCANRCPLSNFCREKKCYLWV
uniref:Uncharacterized protein n=1 Tax=Octopus bimaculoides TaxID=37653 RepID=A0A0L8FTX4_OCTBM